MPYWLMHPPETPLARFAPPPVCPMLLRSTDLPGDDLTRRGIRDRSLEGFSYVQDRRWCWPKSQGPAPSFNRNVISGIMPGASWPSD